MTAFFFLSLLLFILLAKQMSKRFRWQKHLLIIGHHIHRDGHYGLWLDSSLEKGVSAPSQTFGNEPLSDEGTKFDILGVEVWYVGA